MYLLTLSCKGFGINGKQMEFPKYILQFKNYFTDIVCCALHRSFLLIQSSSPTVYRLPGQFFLVKQTYAHTECPRRKDEYSGRL
jgi:hypothetical protein